MKWKWASIFGAVVIVLATTAQLPITWAQWPTTLSTISSNAATGGLVLKSAPGALWRINAQCAGLCYLMLFNATTVPAAGNTTPGNASGNLVDCYQMAPGSLGGQGTVTRPPIQFGPPEQFNIGIVAAISSTNCAVYTPYTSGFINAIVQ